MLALEATGLRAMRVLGAAMLVISVLVVDAASCQSVPKGEPVRGAALAASCNRLFISVAGSATDAPVLLTTKLT
jgi:hypothetical protein